MNFVAQDLQAEVPETLAPQDFLSLGMEPLAEFAAQSKHLDATLAALTKVAGAAAAQALTRLQQDLAAFEPAITILGQVKSGKTTLVNALAGWADLLPSDVNPWTSVVTALHLRPGPDRREVGAKFQLMKADEWDRLLSKGGRLGELAQRADSDGEMEKIRQQIEAMREKSRKRLGKKFELLLGQEHDYGYFDRNLLERYICLGDDFLDEADGEEDAKQGWFADITRSADLYLHCQSIPYQMCIRDTPGVNDTFLMREQVTIAAVRDARVCVVVLSAHQALTSTDMGLIRLISNLKSRDVIIFVNRVDELQNPATEVAEIEKSIRETLARHQGPVDAKIIFGSAYWANKVLSEGIDEFSPASAAALVNWAEVAIPDRDLALSPTEMVWQLSGLPRLNRAVAEHLVSSLGRAHLRKIATAALTIAGSLQAANTVRVSGIGGGKTLDLPAVLQELDALRQAHLATLNDDLSGTTLAYQSRTERAHVSFLERATHSLVRHLEEYGEQDLWEYDPNGLRVLLKSAYSVYVTHATSVARNHYKAAVEDIAELLYTSFGDAVEGIELSLPEPPDAPAPVALAQTIILDFKDGWWRSWWRRTRGYRAFSDRFYQLIAGETEDFIAQFKTVPPRDFTADLVAVLQDQLDQSVEMAREIGEGRGQRDTLKGPIMSLDDQNRMQGIQDLIVDLRRQIKACEKDGTRHDDRG